MGRVIGTKNKPGYAEGGLTKTAGRPRTAYYSNSNLFHCMRNSDTDEINETKTELESCSTRPDLSNAHANINVEIANNSTNKHNSSEEDSICQL